MRRPYCAPRPEFRGKLVRVFRGSLLCKTQDWQNPNHILLAVYSYFIVVFFSLLTMLYPFNPSKLTGYGMYQQVEYFNNRTLCPHCMYVFCICLRTNGDLCHLQHKLIGLYNRDEKCLQRGTNWVFK
jgi:hypothetical protein